MLYTQVYKMKKGVYMAKRKSLIQTILDLQADTMGGEV